MANIEVILPQLGEGVIEATITRWLAEVDSDVTEDDPIVEIATDKVDSEIPSPATGKLVKKFYSEGETPKVGDIIAVIHTGNGHVAESQTKNIHLKQENPKTQVSFDLDMDDHLLPGEDHSAGIKNTNRGIPPFIKHLAAQRGISLQELKHIKGSGAGGKLTKNDVLDYFKNRTGHKALVVNDVQMATNSERPEEYKPLEGEEVIEIGRTRRLIAERMHKSLQTAPHVTSFIDVDVTRLVQWRENIKHNFIVSHGVNLTYTPVITQVVVQALKEFPGINVSLFGNKLIRKKYINIGIATALPDGNLIVPVVKGADKYNLVKLAIEIHQLVQKAKNGALNPGESQGGTFTITNIGQFGNVTGTPIINQPESAVLAVGTIKKRPWVVAIDGIQTIGIRDVVTLALSYDHRIIDGALGGAFLTRIGTLLEQLKLYDLV